MQEGTPPGQARGRLAAADDGMLVLRTHSEDSEDHHDELEPGRSPLPVGRSPLSPPTFASSSDAAPTLLADKLAEQNQELAEMFAVQRREMEQIVAAVMAQDHNAAVQQAEYEQLAQQFEDVTARLSSRIGQLEADKEHMAAKLTALEVELQNAQIAGEGRETSADEPPEVEIEPLMRDGTNEAPPGYEEGDLRRAAEGNDVDTARQLLRAGLNPNAVQETFADWGPLQYAARHGHLDTVKLLIEHNADVRAVDKDGTTAAMQAAFWRHDEVVEYLVELGVTRRSLPVPVCPEKGREVAEPQLCCAYDSSGDTDKLYLEEYAKDVGLEAWMDYFLKVGFDKPSKLRSATERELRSMAIKVNMNLDQATLEQVLEAINLPVGAKWLAKEGEVTMPDMADYYFNETQPQWTKLGHVTILCSAPEFERDGSEVMVGLFALCSQYPDYIKFGYDWGGSSTAEYVDTDPRRRVRKCCLSLACSCPHGVRSSEYVTGPVIWSDPRSVAGSMWFPKYKTKIMVRVTHLWFRVAKHFKTCLLCGF
jgi:hypothetical protein